MMAPPDFPPLSGKLAASFRGNSEVSCWRARVVGPGWPYACGWRRTSPSKFFTAGAVHFPSTFGPWHLLSWCCVLEGPASPIEEGPLRPDPRSRFARARFASTHPSRSAGPAHSDLRATLKRGYGDSPHRSLARGRGLPEGLARPLRVARDGSDFVRSRGRLSLRAAGQDSQMLVL